MINISCLQELVDAVEAEQDPSTGRLVVVNFFAPECYACKSLQPKLRQIAGNNPDVLFIKVNGLQGDLQQYCESMGITRIPYFHFYRGNKRVAEFTANMRPDKLAMLRSEIAAHKPQAIKAADSPQYTALEV
jgi:thiol-disulfide isomerase/thioredoxin